MPQITSKRVRQLLLVTGEAVDPDSLGEEVHLYGPDGQPIDLTPTDMPLDGTTGQVLAKQTDDDFDIAWIDPPVSLPLGGANGQFLGKNSGTDLDVAWKNPPYELPVGGATDQVLAKNSATDRDVKWSTPAAGGGVVYSPGTVMDTWHPVGAAGQPPFISPWANYAVGTQVVQFRKFPDGKVSLSGYTKGGISGQVIFTLPAGYRPPDQMAWLVYSAAGPVLLTVDPNGDVKPTNTTGTTLLATSLISLDTVEFDTETVTTSPGVTVNPAQVTMDTWHTVGNSAEPAFQNNWAALAGTPVQFRKDPMGVVRIRGIANLMTSTAIMTKAIFTLPVGYRPTANRQFLAQHADVDNSQHVIRILVQTDGQVIVYGEVVGTAGGVSGSANSLQFLDNITFDTDSVSQMTGLIGSAGVNMDVWHVVGNPGEPAFVNSWVNFGAPYLGVAFTKLPNGKVQVRGSIKSGTSPAVIFTLPPGYRPSASVVFAVATSGGVNVLGSVMVAANGEVSAVSTNNAFVPLDVIEFDTDTILQTATVGAQPQDTWHLIGGAGEPAYGAGYTNHAGDLPVAFRKYPNGKVRIRGGVNVPAAAGAFFTLPAGYRPPGTQRFGVIDENSGAMVQVYIATDGTLNKLATSATIFDLSTIEFDTDTVSSYSAGIIGPPRVTALPANPVDGQECYFVADATAGVVWHLRYNAASASPYKWEFVGGSEMRDEIVTAAGENTSSTSYTTLTTPGPSIAVPLAGEYDIELSFLGYHGTAGGTMLMSYQNGATAAIDTDGVGMTAGAAVSDMSRSTIRRRKTIAAPATLAARYRTLAGTATFAGTSNLGTASRNMRLRPVRVG